MIGRVFAALARNALSDKDIVAHLTLRHTTPHVSKHRQYDKDGKRIPGNRRLAENSSIKKRMRVGEFTEVKMTPARRREFWHASFRQKWQDISTLADKLTKDRERRRLMRLAA
jgi:hypothetical protein